MPIGYPGKPLTHICSCYLQHPARCGCTSSLIDRSCSSTGQDKLVSPSPPTCPAWGRGGVPQEALGFVLEVFMAAQQYGHCCHAETSIEGAGTKKPPCFYPSSSDSDIISMPLGEGLTIYLKNPYHRWLPCLRSTPQMNSISMTSVLEISC